MQTLLHIYTKVRMIVQKPLPYIPSNNDPIIEHFSFCAVMGECRDVIVHGIFFDLLSDLFNSTVIELIPFEFTNRSLYEFKKSVNMLFICRIKRSHFIVQAFCINQNKSTRKSF